MLGICYTMGVANYVNVRCEVRRYTALDLLTSHHDPSTATGHNTSDCSPVIPTATLAMLNRHNSFFLTIRSVVGDQAIAVGARTRAAGFDVQVEASACSVCYFARAGFVATTIFAAIEFDTNGSSVGRKCSDKHCCKGGEEHCERDEDLHCS